MEKISCVFSSSCTWWNMFSQNNMMLYNNIYIMLLLLTDRNLTSVLLSSIITLPFKYAGVPLQLAYPKSPRISCLHSTVLRDYYPLKHVFNPNLKTKSNVFFLKKNSAATIRNTRRTHRINNSDPAREAFYSVSPSKFTLLLL